MWLNVFLPQGQTYISALAAHSMMYLNWLCSHASEEHSIIAKIALSYKPSSVAGGTLEWKGAHEFIIFDVQEDEFWPEMCSLHGFDNLHVIC